MIITFTAPNAAHGTKDGKTVPNSSGPLESWNRLHQTPSSFPTPPLCPRTSETERAPSTPDRAAIKGDSLDNKHDKERYVPAILLFYDQEYLDRILSVSIPIHLNNSYLVSMCIAKGLWPSYCNICFKRHLSSWVLPRSPALAEQLLLNSWELLSSIIYISPWCVLPT